MPPLYFLHVWWARRPLTPSRAAIQGSLLPGNTDPDLFLRDLGIEKVQAVLNGIPWTLTDKLVKKLESEGSSETSGTEILRVDAAVIRALQKEEEWRVANRESVARIRDKAPDLSDDSALLRWEEENQALPLPLPELGDILQVRRVMGDPAWNKRLIGIAKRFGIRISNLYGYKRSFANLRPPAFSDKTILDPTSGGGSIPFEALRLGHNVIANDLSPVATVILHATLDYPARFGPDLSHDIRHWGEKLISDADEKLVSCFSGDQPLPQEEQNALKKFLSTCPELFEEFNIAHPVDFLYARQVVCPHCRGEAPLLNACWLSKIAGDAWGVRIISDGRRQNAKVRFETYRVHDGKGPDGEDPNFATVRRGVGLCIHCRQAISGDEIKAQARGESELGKWENRLYCVVADRLEPLLSSDGRPQQFKSGPNKGKTRTRKIRFFRAPDDSDFAALAEAERLLNEKWGSSTGSDTRGLIPSEKIPFGQKTSEPLRYGFSRWCEMFTPRQLLGHLTLAQGLNHLRPRIIKALGSEKGRAVV
ncbi:MAG: DNA methylase, partial [Desulfobacteraceae bacterium 4572_88]